MQSSKEASGRKLKVFCAGSGKGLRTLVKALGGVYFMFKARMVFLLLLPVSITGALIERAYGAWRVTPKVTALLLTSDGRPIPGAMFVSHSGIEVLRPVGTPPRTEWKWVVEENPPRVGYTDSNGKLEMPALELMKPNGDEKIGDTVFDWGFRQLGGSCTPDAEKTAYLPLVGVYDVLRLDQIPAPSLKGVANCFVSAKGENSIRQTSWNLECRALVSSEELQEMQRIRKEGCQTASQDEMKLIELVASASPDLVALESLLKQGVDPNRAILPKPGALLPGKSAMEVFFSDFGRSDEDEKKVMALLLTYRGSPHVRGITLDTPMHLAALQKRAAILKTLLEADGEAAPPVDVAGRTVLMNAVYSGDPEVVRVALGSPGVRSQALVREKFGMTARDILVKDKLSYNPTKPEYLEIERLLREAEGK